MTHAGLPVARVEPKAKPGFEARAGVRPGFRLRLNPGYGRGFDDGAPSWRHRCGSGFSRDGDSSSAGLGA